LVPSPNWRPAERRALVMALLGGLFFLRVIGQALVTYARVGWLPAVEHWQSGLLPYRTLLASQVAILGVMSAMIAGVWRGRGRFNQRRPRLGRMVRGFGRLYLASMVVRYAVTMALRPQWRWFGHSIPIAFHGVLATYLIVYSGVLIGQERPASDEPSAGGAAIGPAEPLTAGSSTR
jgi:hypothetical protein